MDEERHELLEGSPRQQIRGDILQVLVDVLGWNLRKLALEVDPKVCELPQVPAEHVDEHLEDVASDLLAQAHFEEFVPLLVHRHVRSRLLAELRRSQASPIPISVEA